MTLESPSTPTCPLSPAQTLVGLPSISDSAPKNASLVSQEREDQIKLSSARKFTLLALFCLAQFLDVFNNSALFSAIPTLRRDLGFDESGATWLISAYQLTFASFLLIAGKIADVYDPSEPIPVSARDGRTDGIWQSGRLWLVSVSLDLFPWEQVFSTHKSR
jgi:hypothetical protein